MIITRTPFRVSFAGGGSDLESFYSQNGFGAVVSAAITKYMYIVIHPYFHDKIRIKYSKTEDVCDVNEIQHPIVKECLKKVKIGKGVEIASFADVPKGTGLGSSSAFTVGLLNALYAYKGTQASKEQLAREACEIEINILSEPIGKQDQYSVSYGGMNYIKFNKDESVEVIPISISESVQKKMRNNLILYYTDAERKAATILTEQNINMSSKKGFGNVKKILLLVDELMQAFKEENVGALGEILHKGWCYKKGLASNVTCDAIDALYSELREYGIYGGKLLGAGGGGFILAYADEHMLAKEKLLKKFLTFDIDNEGSKIIFNS